MRGHDFEEFTGIIRRHGLWSTSATSAGLAMAEQLSSAIEDVVSFVGTLDGGARPAEPPDNVDPETGEIL